MRNILAITNRNGGVGKTTVAVNLAAALSINYKLNCVLIDADPIGSSSLWVEKSSIQRLKLKRLTLPNSPNNKHHALQTWGATLSNISLECDVVIADLPPIELGVFNELIHQVSYVIVPVGLSSLEWEAGATKQATKQIGLKNLRILQRWWRSSRPLSVANCPARTRPSLSG